MSFISQLLEFIQRILVWWVTILPWEAAVHIRAGKRVRILCAGIHLRLPFIDQVFVQTTRLRVLQMPPQTVTTADGKTVTLITNLGYSIENIERLYQTLFHADQTLANMLMASVAQVVAARQLSDATPAIIEQEAAKDLSAADFGLKFEYIKVTGYAVVKTYRLIQDGHWLPDGLNTATAKT